VTDMETMKSEKIKEILAYISVCIFWGSTYLAIRIGVGELPPMFFAGIRFLIAGSLVLIFAYIKGMEFPKTFTEVRKISIVGILLLFVCNGSMVWAEQVVPSNIAAILAATVPLFMALIEFVIWGKKINIRALSGLLVGFGGVVVLMTYHSSVAQFNIKYIMLILFSTFIWAVGSIYSQTFKASGNIITHIGIQMLAASIILLVTAMFLGEFSRIHIGLKGAAATAYLVVFGSLIGYSCYIYILKKWPSAKAGTYAYVNPMVAVLLGVIILNEPVTLNTILSIFTILGGVFLVQTSKVSSISTEKDDITKNIEA
jgi:Permeases of the drug/metabolite transporter (DMT) superfamily